MGETIGVATNNVAEYRALLRGLELAPSLGAETVAIVNDSELVAKQMTGAYKVKHPAMKQLHAMRRRLCGSSQLEHSQRPARSERARRCARQPRRSTPAERMALMFVR